MHIQQAANIDGPLATVKKDEYSYVAVYTLSLRSVAHL
jgi:hypothetical protein